MFTDSVAANRSCTHFEQQVSATPMIVVSAAVADAPCKLSARSDGASATTIGSMTMGVTDTCRTKWVPDQLTGSHHSRIKGHFVTIFDVVRSRSRSV